MSTRFSRSSFRWFVACSVAMLLAMVQPQAKSAHRRAHLDSRIAAAAGHAGKNKVRVIVRTEGTDRKALKQILMAEGIKVRREHSMIGAISLEIPEKDLYKLADKDDVLSISIDEPIHAQLLG